MTTEENNIDPKDTLYKAVEEVVKSTLESNVEVSTFIKAIVEDKIARVVEDIVSKEVEYHFNQYEPDIDTTSIVDDAISAMRDEAEDQVREILTNADITTTIDV